MNKILVTLTRSTNSTNKKQQAIVQALGLRKIGDSVLHEDNAAIRGMAVKVAHLVSVEVATEEE